MNGYGPEVRIEEAVRDLRTGDYVTVTWIDASQSKQVNLHRKPILNHSVETRKSTTGRFVEIQLGDTWHDPHLILSIERTDELWEIVSIPLVLVRQVSSVGAEVPQERSASRSEKRPFADRSLRTKPNNETTEAAEKEEKIEIKSSTVTVTEIDYRALIAILLITGLLILLFKGDHQGASIIGPLAGSAVGWYFVREARR